MRRALTIATLAIASFSLAAAPAEAAPPLGFSNNFVKKVTPDGLLLQLTCPRGQTYGVDGGVSFAPSDPDYGAEFKGGLTQTYLAAVDCTGRPQKVTVDFGGQSKDGEVTYPSVGSRVVVCGYAEDFADLTRSYAACSDRELVLSAPR